MSPGSWTWSYHIVLILVGLQFAGHWVERELSRGWPTTSIVSYLGEPVTVYDFDLNILKLLLQGFIYEYRNINEILHQPRLWHCGCVWWRMERWGQTSRAASFVRQGRMGRATRTRTETLKLKWNQKWKLNTLLICLFALDNECKFQQ